MKNAKVQRKHGDQIKRQKDCSMARETTGSFEELSKACD